MKEIKLTCEVITPLFMGGANMEPEIRTQSINGVVRWWFRTLGGSQDEEKKLFGWAGEKSQKGLVKFVLVPSDKTNKVKTFEKQFKEEGYVLQTGLNYIGFSLDQRFNKNQNKPRRQYLDVGYSFDLKLLFSPFLKEEEIKRFFGALWCAFYLGNFGSRARRGFGSIVMKKISGNFNNFISFVPEGDAESWLKGNYEKIRELFSKTKEIEIYIFDRKDDKTVQSWVEEVQKDRSGRFLAKRFIKPSSESLYDMLRSLNSWSNLLNLMGFTLMAFRSYLTPDYNVAKSILQGQYQKDPLIKRSIFGLPLNFYFSSIRNSGIVFPMKNGKKLRRASPLIFKVVKSGVNLEGLIIFIRGKFLPDDVYLKLEEVKLQKPDYSVIEEYLGSLREKGIIRRLI